MKAVTKPHILPATFSIEFEKTRMVTALRQYFGYSAYELSFLLGQRDFYVRDVENPLHTLHYSVNENNYLRQVFDCGLEKIMPARVEPALYHTKAEVSLNEAGLKVYQIYKASANGNWKLSHTVTEELKRIELPLESSVTMDQVLDYITELFKNAYFEEGKTALTIFKNCLANFKEPVRPLFVADSLGYFTGKRKSPRLIDQKNEARRTVYLQA